MTMKMSGRSEAKRQLRLTFQRDYALQTGGIDVRRTKLGFGEAPVKPILTFSATCVLLVLPAVAWANSLGSIVSQPSIRTFSYSGAQTQALAACRTELCD
jgi:hypothetical protein